jgi:hypothetical protein
MDLSLLDRLLWIASFVGHSMLLLVLVVKGRWRAFPVFTLLIGFSTLRTILLFSIYRYGSEQVYAAVYWGAEVLDLALQLGLVYEMASIVLKPASVWVRDARPTILLLGFIGTLIAAGLAFAASPGRPSTLGGWNDKAQLFSIMLFCVLFASMMVASSRFGLVWRNHVMGLGRGLTVWAIISLLVEACHSYFGPDWHFDLLNHIRIGTYIGATVYWIFTFWRPEPKSRTLSPEMQTYLSSLQKQMGGKPGQ